MSEGHALAPKHWANLSDCPVDAVVFVQAGHETLTQDQASRQDTRALGRGGNLPLL